MTEPRSVASPPTPGVDPALVVQVFGSKKDLFAAATVSPVTLAELSAQPAEDFERGARPSPGEPADDVAR